MVAFVHLSLFHLHTAAEKGYVAAYNTLFHHKFYVDMFYRILKV